MGMGGPPNGSPSFLLGGVLTTKRPRQVRVDQLTIAEHCRTSPAAALRDRSCRHRRPSATPLPPPTLATQCSAALRAASPRKLRSRILAGVTASRLRQPCARSGTRAPARCTDRSERVSRSGLDRMWKMLRVYSCCTSCRGLRTKWAYLPHQTPVVKYS